METKNKVVSMAEACFARCSNCFIRESDTVEDVRMKRLMVPLLMFLLLHHAFQFVSRGEENTRFFFSYYIFTTTDVVFLVCARQGIISMKANLMQWILASTIGLFNASGFASANMRSSPLLIIVLLLDMALIFNTDRVIPVTLFLTMTYIVVDRVEKATRFGFYELWANDGIPIVCSCADPPCTESAGVTVTTLTTPVLVLLVDFNLTRAFAVGIRYQLRRIEASVKVASQVAAALARYDVDGAEKAIKLDNELPAELTHSYLQLVANLRSYKAYLPHSCLVPQDARQGELRDTEATCEEADGGSVSDGPHTPSSKATSGSVTTHSTEAFGRMHSLDLKAAIQRRRVSLAARNMIGYLSGELAAQSNAEWIAADVEQWCSTVVEDRGVVDAIGGDRRYASFNARQACGEHASAAIRVLSSQGDGNWSGCVVTGQAVCGDFGSASALRFMVLGRVSSSLHPLERIAAQWRTKVLADGEAFSSACFNWQGEMLGAVLMAKRDTKRLCLYSMISKRRRIDGVGSDEWMYELENMAKSDYDDVNDAKAVLIKARLNALPCVDVEEIQGEGDEVVLWRVKEVGLWPC
eukprot:Hpha_TRINITY_DN15628_c6_g4::TRINITY_DN15628_c6_g4_i2::g.98088::m.98088